MGGGIIRLSPVWWRESPDRARAVFEPFREAFLFVSFDCKRRGHLHLVGAEFVGDDPAEVVVSHGEAQRAWKVSDLGPSIADEMWRWFREIHRR